MLESKIMSCVGRKGAFQSLQYTGLCQVIDSVMYQMSTPAIKAKTFIRIPGNCRHMVMLQNQVEDLRKQPRGQKDAQGEAWE